MKKGVKHTHTGTKPRTGNEEKKYLRLNEVADEGWAVVRNREPSVFPRNEPDDLHRFPSGKGRLFGDQLPVNEPREGIG